MVLAGGDAWRASLFEVVDPTRGEGFDFIRRIHTERACGEQCRWRAVCPEDAVESNVALLSCDSLVARMDF